MGEEDWRAQKFWWNGKLSLEEGHYRWEGAWVGSFTGRPKEEEFLAAPNKFQITGPTATKTASQISQGLRIIGHYPAAARAVNYLAPPSEVAAFVKGSYLMDNGDGPERFKDKACHLAFCKSPETHGVPTYDDYDVKGRGDTEFGVFYVQGNYNASDGRLCVERTYCDEDDATFMTMPGPAKKARKKKK